MLRVVPARDGAVTSRLNGCAVAATAERIASLRAATHYSFGAAPKNAERPREKKGFMDLFETKDAVANQTTLDEAQYSFKRLFWAKPIDHADDTELGDKKIFEASMGARSHFQALHKEGEEVLARGVPPSSPLWYFRKHIGGLTALQCAIELVITVAAFVLLRCGVIERQCVHDWWNRTMPIAGDFASPAIDYTEDLAWPMHVSRPVMNDLVTAHCIGTWSIPLQLALTWAAFPMVLRRTESWRWLADLRRKVTMATEDAERSAKRPKFF